MPHDKHVLRAETNEDDMYAAIDLCIPKIKEQLEKESEKRETMVRKGGRELKEMIQEENAE